MVAILIFYTFFFKFLFMSKASCALGSLAAQPKYLSSQSTASRPFVILSSNDMDVEVLIIFYLSREKRKVKKRHWIHPSYFLERHAKGLFHTYFKDLHTYPDRFFNYTRMSVQSFDNLLENIRNSIQVIDNHMRACITPDEKLVITLRYFATECSMMEIGHNFRIRHTTVRDIIYEVCMAI